MPTKKQPNLADLTEMLGKLKGDVMLLVQSGRFEQSDSVMLGIDAVWGEARSMVLDWHRPVHGSDEANALAIQRSECLAICEQTRQIVEAERPRFKPATEAGSITEASKVDRVLQLLEKLMPLLVVLFS
jgi:hypothetical protein